MADKVPTYSMWVSVDGAPATLVVASVTNYIRASGYNSGDYEACVAGAPLHYSACGSYSATYQGGWQHQAAPRYGSDESVTFDFSASGGPRLQIMSGERRV